MKAQSDTNILIDYLNGIDAARKEICRYETLLISPITWMEVMVGVNDDEHQAVRSFLSRFTQVNIDVKVAEMAVSLRRQHKMRLPDASSLTIRQSAGQSTRDCCGEGCRPTFRRS